MSLTAEEAAELAAAPAKVSVDGQTVDERSADDVIKLDGYASGKKAVKGSGSRRKNPFQLLRTTRLNPPGSV